MTIAKWGAHSIQREHISRRCAGWRLRWSRVLEMGCGEGRLTRGIADEAASVLAFDPDAASIAEAKASFPSELADRVAFQVASAEEIEIERGSFDLVVFSWSL